MIADAHSVLNSLCSSQLLLAIASIRTKIECNVLSFLLRFTAKCTGRTQCHARNMH